MDQTDDIATGGKDRIDAIKQNDDEQRAGMGQSRQDQPGQQREKEDEALAPGQKTGGTGGAGAARKP